jgi:uncharacterized Zn finger protein (UPF0148 family)
MKVLCPSCERLVELVDLRVERGALVVRCPACNTEQRQALPSGSSAGLAGRGASPVSDDENDEGPTIILLTPSGEGGPLAIAPPGAAAPPNTPAPVARFDGPGPKKPVVIPPPPPPEAEAPAVSAARPASGPELNGAPRQRRVVDAEFAELLTQLDDVHPPPRKGPTPTGSTATVAPPPGPRGSTVQIPPGHCPKCIAPRTREATLCPACGLVFANFRAEDHQPSAALEAAWYGLTERWAKAEEHEKFLQYAFNLDELARAGRLYRIKLANNPDDAQAKAALESMVRMASTAASLAARTDPSEVARRRRKVLAVSAMLFVVIPIAAILVTILLHAR